MELLESIDIGEILEKSVKIFAVLSIFIEIVPIKINPWSAILKWIGDRINADLTLKVNNLEKTVTGLKNETREQQAVNARIRILRFGDEVRLNVKHTKEHFDQTLKDIDFYENYCLEHPDFKNSMTVMTKEHIKEVYDECLSKNSFLK